MVEGREIQFSLSETFDQKPHTLTPQEDARQKKGLYVYAPRWDYIPSGNFCLSIEDVPHELSHIRRSWRDGKFRRVENCIADCVAILILPHLVKAMKAVDKQRELQRKRWEEERKRDEEARRKREEYNYKAKLAEQFLEAWRKSEFLRQFANSIHEKLKSENIQDEQKKELQTISQWITRHAENTDPLIHFDWMIRKFNEAVTGYF